MSKLFIQVLGILFFAGTALAQNQYVPHDSPDYGAPLKIGSKATSALPTAVASGDRANAVSDLFGRVLTSSIPPEVQTWRSLLTAAAIQTGTAIWTPAAGKKIAIDFCQMGLTGATNAKVILWFGAAADTTYTEGTDQPVFKGRLVTSATTITTLAYTAPNSTLFSTTADNILRITTDAAAPIDVLCYGFEF